MAFLSPSSSPCRTCWLSAFTGGLLTVTTATRPRRSRSTDLVMAVMAVPLGSTGRPGDAGMVTRYNPARERAGRRPLRHGRGGHGLPAERERGLPANAINRAIVASGEAGAWARLERGELTVSAFCAPFEADCRAQGV